MQPRQNVLLPIGNALRINNEIAEINRGGWRQGGDALLDFAEGQVIHENRLDPILERGIVDYNCERGFVWERSEDVFNDRVQVNRNRDCRVVGGERRAFYGSRV